MSQSAPPVALAKLPRLSLVLWTKSAAVRVALAGINGKAQPRGFHEAHQRTGDQRFFLAYAQAHRGKLRNAALRARVATDVHAPEPWRVLTVRNTDSWYPAFNVQQGQKLFLAPAQRVRICG